MKKKILIMAGYYLPSVKGGGPIQSIKNLIDNLGGAIDFYVLAADRDLGDEKPFNNIIVDEWTEVNNAKIYYTDMKLLNIKKLKKIVEMEKFDCLYLNSFFSYRDSIMLIILNKLNMLPNIKIILAPRGQFSSGALGMKSFKKNIFIKISKLLRLYNNVMWHATTEFERNDIKKEFGENIKVQIANNLTKKHTNTQLNKFINKEENTLKLVYIARIHPMKNLLQTLEILQKNDGNIEFSIYGPIEDPQYWQKCQILISNMRKNIKISYYGAISNNQVDEIYRQNHVSILLTLGENFGHSIAEALIGGCPVIISDRTPWKDLSDYGVGYDIPLDKAESIKKALDYYTRMSELEYNKYSEKAFEYARRNSNTEEHIKAYYELFG